MTREELFYNQGYETGERDAELFVDTLETDGEVVETYEGEQIKSAYIGTVFELTPSGKYYTPWAHSNAIAGYNAKGEAVIEPDVLRDQGWYEGVEDALSRFGAWLQAGDGDPCDLYVCCAAE